MTLRMLVSIAGIILAEIHGLGCALGVDESSLQQCNDISKIDFRNTTIILEDEESFKLVHGRGCASDGIPGKCDWKQTLTMDRMIYPDKAHALRLVTVNSSHLTGSGAWDYVIVVECLGGSMEVVFSQKYRSGAKLEVAADGALKIESGLWLTDDPACCPSKKSIETLKWNGERASYERSDTELIPNSQRHP